MRYERYGTAVVAWWDSHLAKSPPLARRRPSLRRRVIFGLLRVVHLLRSMTHVRMWYMWVVTGGAPMVCYVYFDIPLMHAD